MSIRKPLAMAALAALCAAAAAPAQAGNVTTPALGCRPLFPSAVGPEPIGLSPYSLHNRDRIAHYVVCPITRQGDADGVTVLIRGHTAPDTLMRCGVFSMNARGIPVAVQSRVTGAAGGPFTMSFPIAATLAPANGHLSALCLLPPHSTGHLLHFQTQD